MRIEAHARCRPAPRSSLTVPGDGMKPLRRVLGIDADLDGMAAAAMSSWRDAQRLAAGDADHLAHQVDAGDELGHRMLDLDAGVHLDEVEVARLRRRRDIRACRRRDSAPPRASATAEAQSCSRTSSAQRPATAPPPTPSGGGAAASIRARSNGSTSLAVAEHLHLDVAGALDQPSRHRARRRRRRPAPRRSPAASAARTRRRRGRCGCRVRRRRPPP